MKKRLSKVGNGLALFIDKSLAEALGVGERSEVILEFDGERVIIYPADRGEPSCMKGLRMLEEILTQVKR